MTVLWLFQNTYELFTYMNILHLQKKEKKIKLNIMGHLIPFLYKCFNNKGENIHYILSRARQPRLSLKFKPMRML